MTREATEADLPDLLRWGADFAASIDLPGGFDPDSAEAFFRLLMGTENGILLIAEGGAVGALLHPAPYNRAHLTGQELFWWVDPAFRGAGTGKALFDALQAAVANLGANSFSMSTLGDHAIGQFYASRGYRQTDKTYTITFDERA